VAGKAIYSGADGLFLFRTQSVGAQNRPLEVRMADNDRVKFKVVGMAACKICDFRKSIEDSEITSTSREKAMDAYERKHALCPKCLDAGKVSAVVFDGRINVDTLPQC
jgi:hypothetical protein